MSFASLALVVLAAFIHATWNLISKRAAAAGPSFVFAYNLVAFVVYAPWVLWLLAQGSLAWSWQVTRCIVVSGVIHLAYSLCLQRGYQVVDLSVVYPVARGTMMIGTMFGMVILHEPVGLWRLIGCAVMIAGVVALSAS